LKRRGFDFDPNSDLFELPEYAYAKDASRWWELIQNYVREVTFVHYTSDDQMREDITLRSFWMAANIHGYPEASSFVPTTREEMVDQCAGIIFIATIKHAITNSPQVGWSLCLMCVVVPGISTI
jgi:hypothetical protein